jgi:hypothetical protein
MQTKETVLDLCDPTDNGTIQLRFAKRILEDGEVVRSEWHRAALAPGSLIDSEGSGDDKKHGAFDLIDAHLGAMGFPPIADADQDTIRAAISAAWTAKVVADYRAAEAAAAAAY